MKYRKMIILTLTLLLLTSLCCTSALAAGGDVAGAVEQTWTEAAKQIKSVVEKVVFPALDMILAIAFFVKLGGAYFDYRQRGQFEWTGPAILFACLIFSLVAPKYICQDTIFGDFSPQSKTADALSAALGSRTVLSGSVSQGKESSQSLQMMERALMTPDELKSIPKGEFVVMKTGTHPMRTKLRLFLDWGITFDPDGYRMPERAARKIAYIDPGELIRSIHRSCTKSPYNMEGGR